MSNSYIVGGAFFFACPACGFYIYAPWMAVVDLALPAEFEEAARSFHGWAWCGVGFVAGSGFIVRFVVPADACVEGADLVEVSCPSHAQSCDVGVDGVEVVLGGAFLIDNGCGVAG